LEGKDSVLERIHQAGVIGIFRVDQPENCLRAMEALMEGGLSVFEVTTTTPQATELITEARRKYGQKALVGIGTVLDGQTAEKGIDAGAQFVVSPSLHKDVLDACKSHGVVSCPGTFSATEIVQAWRWGADLIKVFPVSQVGPGYISSMLGPLPWVRLVPTGGVDAENAGSYIRAGAYALGVGGALVSKKAISEGRFGSLTEAARAILQEVKAARGESVS
jgi:2-dehydro-3-deoxyphosphogluconate aldolase/(4S)-4-hydroxy-2-oxoglutarate aldolase